MRVSHALEHEASENVTLKMEIAEALGVHRHTFLDADGNDAIVEQVETLRVNNTRLQAQLDAARAALDQYNDVWLYKDWEVVANLLDKAPINGWETRYATALGFVIGKIRQVAKLQEQWNHNQWKESGARAQATGSGE